MMYNQTCPKQQNQVMPSKRGNKSKTQKDSEQGRLIKWVPHDYFFHDMGSNIL